MLSDALPDVVSVNWLESFLRRFDGSLFFCKFWVPLPLLMCLLSGVFCFWTASVSKLESEYASPHVDCDERHFHERSLMCSSLSGPRPININIQFLWCHCDNSVDPACLLRWCSSQVCFCLAWAQLFRWKLHLVSQLRIKRRWFLILNNQRASTWVTSSMETRRCLAWEHGAASFKGSGQMSLSR